MQQWFTLDELTGNDGLPATKFKIFTKAKNENWQSRQRKNWGGGIEYHISSLPQETQRHLTIKYSDEPARELEFDLARKLKSAETAKQWIKNQAETTPKINSEQKIASAYTLDESAQNRMNAKIEILRHWEQFKKRFNGGKIFAQRLFSLAYNRGHISVPEWVKKTIPTTSQPSLMRWEKKVSHNEQFSLAGRYGNRRNLGIFYTNSLLQDYVMVMKKTVPRCGIKQIWQGIRANLHLFKLEKTPSTKTIARFLRNLKLPNSAEYANNQELGNSLQI